MNISVEDLDKINSVASSSGVFIGILGGLIKALTSARGLIDGLIKVFVGCVVSWLSAPFARAYLPLECYPMAVFLFGYGGTELIEFIQKLFRQVLSARIDAIVRKITGQGNTVKQFINLN